MYAVCVARQTQGIEQSKTQHAGKFILFSYDKLMDSLQILTKAVFGCKVAYYGRINNYLFHVNLGLMRMDGNPHLDESNTAFLPLPSQIRINTIARHDLLQQQHST